uniref:Chromosome (Plasmid) partitioning protein ParA n=1 Tax=Enterovibrio norvegicus TaxID=188144 RepID=A0A0H3ZW64_9GAMM|nr:Chromosome (plasmid) partitioning protein ParA [Enterovibrio norvegicus]
MGKIISVANGKGGVGKSTHATNLAIDLHRQGKKVLLADAEKSGTSIALLARGDIDVMCIYDRMAGTMLSALKYQYDYIIVDTAGVNNSTQDETDNLQELINSKIIAVSDLVIVPITPSPVDMRKTLGYLQSIEPYVECSRGALKVLVLLNRFRSKEELSIAAEKHLEKAQLNGYFSLCPIKVRQSTIIEKSDGLFKSVNEYKPSSLIANDVKRVKNHVITMLEG